MSQKKIGNNSEKLVCKILQFCGYWCHLFEYNPNGQPCDIVALKGNTNYLIDVKHCSDDRFDFKRIEPNQHTCFKYAKDMCNINNLGFAIHFESDNSIRWLNYQDVEKSFKNSVSKDELKDFKNEISNK